MLYKYVATKLAVMLASWSFFFQKFRDFLDYIIRREEFGAQGVLNNIPVLAGPRPASEHKRLVAYRLRDHYA
jgi:hypothetical protein